MDAIKEMRAVLKPSGTAPIVRLRIGGDAGFYTENFISQCLDCLDRKIMLVSAGIEDSLNPLERLAVTILMASSYITFEDLKNDE